MSDVEVKIGNKFHLLDKDCDGVLTRKDMAHVLQTILKRELKAEEATSITVDIDYNKDGVFSMLSWLNRGIEYHWQACRGWVRERFK